MLAQTILLRILFTGESFRLSTIGPVGLALALGAAGLVADAALGVVLDGVPTPAAGAFALLSSADLS